MNVVEDTAVYGFRVEHDVAVPIFRFEAPTPTREGEAFCRLALRPLETSARVRVLLQATHERHWSRWQGMSWTLLESSPTAPVARELWRHGESIDITRDTQSGPSYGEGPWVDPDGITVTGQHFRFRDRAYCQDTTRFQWSGDRLVQRYQRSVCTPD
ncbi:MAG: hypothetical protein R3A52_05915 [Polyangiales bacterium]